MESWVMVTTIHRGVFFGRLVRRTNKRVVLAEARDCLRWSTDVKGFLGLAAIGPTAGCRIGPAVAEFSIPRGDVTSIALCSEQAVAAWKAAPWA